MTSQQCISHLRSRRPAPSRNAASTGGRKTRLDAGEEVELARVIEAGVLAAALLASSEVPADATQAELSQLVEAGDAARDRFHLANLGLVHQAVREMSDSLADPDDLFQEGCLGLVEAIMRFDHTRGVRFSTHAYRWIRKRMVPASRRAGCAADEPESRLHFIAVVTHARRLLEETGRPSGPAAVAQDLGRSVRWVESHWSRSLRIHDDFGSVPDNLRMSSPDVELTGPADWWLDELPPREWQLLVHRYGLRNTVCLADADLARLLGVVPHDLQRIDALAREHVRQLLSKGQCDSFVLPRVA